MVLQLAENSAGISSLISYQRQSGRKRWFKTLLLHADWIGNWLLQVALLASYGLSFEWCGCWKCGENAKLIKFSFGLLKKTVSLLVFPFKTHSKNFPCAFLFNFHALRDEEGQGCRECNAKISGPKMRNFRHHSVFSGCHAGIFCLGNCCFSGGITCHSCCLGSFYDTSCFKVDAIELMLWRWRKGFVRNLKKWEI